MALANNTCCWWSFAVRLHSRKAFSYNTVTKLRKASSTSFKWDSDGNETRYDDKTDDFHTRHAKPLYKDHIPISKTQRIALAVGSGIAGLYNPRRYVMIADLGETTGWFALQDLRTLMNEDPVGRQILRDRPRVNSSTMKLDKLKTLPDGTFGREYVRFLETNAVTPDTRTPVRFVDDEELAYVMRRYREIHDFIHTLLGLSVSVPDEIVVKWFEMTQTGLPMCALSSFLGPLKLSLKDKFILTRYYVPWVIRCGRNSKQIMNVYFEKHFEQSIDSFRQELCITMPPKVAFDDSN